MSNPYLQSARSVSLSGSIRYLTGEEKAFSPRHVLSCSASAGVRDGMLPGAVVSRQCTLMLHNENNFFTAGLDPYGARVQLFVQAENALQPLAVFQVTACAQTDGSAFLTLSGQDVLGLYFDAAFQDDLSYPATLQAVAERVLEKAAFPASLSFPCAEQLVPVRPEWGDISLRGALGFIAQACGCFVMVSPAGEIGFYPAFDGGDAPYEIFPENTFRLSGGDVTFGPLKGVSIVLHGAEKEDAPLTVSLDDTALDATNCLYLERNPLFMKGQSFSRTLATDMLSALRGMQLSRMQLSWQGDPQVILGKRIRVWDTKGGFTDTCVTSLSFAADSGFSMQTDCTYQKKGTFVGRVFTSSGGINSALLQGEINGALLKAESVTARKIAASSVTAQKLEAGCVTAEKVASDSISARHLQAGSVTSQKLDAGSITTEKLAAGAVTADKIAGKTITANQLQTGLITAGSGLISDSAIGTAQIADGSITDAKIVGLTASKITAGTINAADVNIINLKADNITAGTLNGKVIPQLGTDKIADGAISGVKIVNGAVNTDKISDGAVTAAKIVSSAVTTDKLAANAVTANKILSGAITTDKLSANAVTTDKLAAQSVTANKLASDVGRSLDLSSNTSINLIVDSMNNRIDAIQGQADYVQFTKPTGSIEIGDTWTQIAAPQQTWGEIQNTTLQTLKTKQWGELYYNNVCYYVWNGLEWVQLLDDAAQKRTISGIEQAANKVAIRVEEVAGKTPEVLRNTSVEVDLAGIRMKTGGTFEVESGNFDLDAEGKMTAKAGSIGGWEIAPGSLKSGTGTSHVRLSTEDDTYGIWAGSEAAGGAPFRVSKNGTVYLTQLYVTDENGNAQTSPVNLRTSYWKMDKAYSRAVKTLEIDGNTLIVELYDGTVVNFKKASEFDNFHVTAAGSGSNNVTITVNAVTELAEVLGSQTITATLSIPNKRVSIGAAGASANGAYVDCTGIYNDGWNECIDNCRGGNVLTNYYEAGETLYDRDGNVATGPWYKGTIAWRYTIPAKK